MKTHCCSPANYENRCLKNYSTLRSSAIVAANSIDSYSNNSAMIENRNDELAIVKREKTFT